jgi:hypothetical protein
VSPRSAHGLLKDLTPAEYQRISQLLDSERARRQEWPDDAWKTWRYRRASLARVLARRGMMREVAQAYGVAL